MASLRNMLILPQRHILKPRNPESAVIVSKRRIMDRTQWNKPYSYGFSKFAHDQPEELTILRKCWMVFMTTAFICCFLDWAWIVPIVSKKIGDLTERMGFKRLEVTAMPVESGVPAIQQAFEQQVQTDSTTNATTSKDNPASNRP